MLAQFEAQRQRELISEQEKEMMDRAALDEEERIRREEERILEEDTQRIIRANEEWINKRNEIFSYFFESVNYKCEISKYFESYNVDYTKYINLFISFLRNSEFYKRNIKIIVNNYLSQINKEVLETKKQII